MWKEIAHLQDYFIKTVAQEITLICYSAQSPDFLTEKY